MKYIGILIIGLTLLIPSGAFADHCGRGGCSVGSRLGAVREAGQARRAEGRGLAQLLPRNWGR